MADDLLTLPQLAKEIGIHRVTLKRMEDRGVIPEAKWAKPPQHGRRYSRDDVAKIKAAIDKYAKEKQGSKEYVE
jgi:DNA-binding transcriptional MerR regulator